MAAETMIGVHLDLKGVNFRPAYIPQLLRDLAGQGVNAVLVEYEDIFPFEKRPKHNGTGGLDVDIAYDRSVVWSRKTLAGFLEEAGANGIEVIPLQQCLGHFEYVFGWKRYRRFALNKRYPSTLDLENPKAVAFVHEMLRQVIEAHPDSLYVHLGMDEAHALVEHAKAKKRDVVAMFLEHLDGLCAICEGYGKTPIIWSDMLEDHMTPAALRLFEPFRDRVVMNTWDYTSGGETVPTGRLSGFRVSREWLAEPENPAAPVISRTTVFLEDMADQVRALVEPYRRGRHFTPMFQADMWTRLGFRVLGASAIRSSSHLAVLPHYNRLIENIRAWSRAVERSGAMGQIATSWARGTSWGPSNFSIDLTWPLIHELAVSMGVLPRPFFDGIEPATVDRIIRTLGRSRGDWRLEGAMADEMEELAPRLKGDAGHRYEWESIMLMARVLELQRRAEYNLAEVEHFHANVRPAEPEWQRRIREQKQTLRDIAAMRKRVRSHFARRYHGEAFEEWVRDLFDLHEAKIKDAQKVCQRKLKAAQKVYARR